MPVSYDDDNLAKHKVSHDEIDEVLDTDLRIECEMTPSDRGNERVMLVGFTLGGRLLEIGIEFFDDHEHCFHANDATKQYRRKFEQEIRS